MEFVRDRFPQLKRDESGWPVESQKKALDELLESLSQQIVVAKKEYPWLVKNLQQLRLDIERDVVA